MKLTAQQQLDVRQHLLQVTVLDNSFDEVYDHILSALEQKPGTFKMKHVKEFIHTEFAEMINTPQEKQRYQRINTIMGLTVSLIALMTYWLTMEPTVSFWDCGEFIATSSKLQVGHQPGAPLFLMIGRMFSLLAMGNTAKIAYWINFSAVLASAATILFLFWTITAIAAKVYRSEKLSTKTFSIMAAGTIGALAYTFSDTFWFSAVEAEVYALSSLFTAITFWAILKWESQQNDRWLVLIAFIVGLSTGVHLLSLLAIPAVTLAWYFKKSAQPTSIGTLKALLAGCLIVGLVQFLIIQYFVLFAAETDLFFVNTLGLSFGSGAIFFLLVFTGSTTWAIRYSIQKHKYNLNLGLLCLVFLLFGFSSYFMILIRADAKTNINLSNPDNPFSLYSYLGRINYGSTPLVYGNTFDAKTIDQKETGHTYRKGKTQYEISGSTYKNTYDKNLFFPRTYSQKENHPAYYRQWLNMAEGETPSFAQNLQFFSSWQLGFMYWRYFLWNFAGRQNDFEGQGDTENGNWISGIKALDSARLGNQQDLPQSVTANEGHNIYYGLPLILGIAGLIWLYRRNKSEALVLLSLFFFTGIAIIIYLNQDPLQVRERDYAYIGSFYAFSIFIGFGMLALKELTDRFAGAKLSLVLAALLCISVPALMGSQGWDDHNRSRKTTARDWAKNYLNSCAPNAILFTNADNDTYPLWYAQEVEGIRTDVRVLCVQFLPDAGYINQMKKRMNASAPLPVSMTESQYAEGTRDYLPYVDYGLTDSVELKDLFAVMTSDNRDDQVQMSGGSYMNFLPSKKLKLTVDTDQLVRTHTIKDSERSRAAKSMEWVFNKSYASKGDLAIFDILVHNNWERPVYFATSVSEDTYIGLDKYLYLEGYAYRLLPFKVEPGDERDKSDRTNTDVMYDHVLNQMDFSGFKESAYLDPQTRAFMNGTWAMNNSLSTNLILEGKTAQADLILKKSLKELPLRNYSIRDTIGRISTIQNLYALGHLKEANILTKDTSDFLSQEFSYIESLDPRYQQAQLQNIRMGLYVLSNLDKLTAGYGQKELNQRIQGKLNRLADKFGIKV
ncbi:MAG: DUF2723 domain-containing protein [Pedobacter sp.]|uniref:glycosyltransferase family 117 protein n=1 Tax=Pedobacter sp. TaxID=1411316 RepID=UPI0033993E96